MSCYFLIAWSFGSCLQVCHCVCSEYAHAWGKGAARSVETPSDSPPALNGCFDSGVVDCSKWP